MGWGRSQLARLTIHIYEIERTDARLMKLEAGCRVATSEVPKPENEAEPDAKLLSEHLPQEARTKSKSRLGMEAEKEPLGAKFLGPSPGQDLGLRLSSWTSWWPHNRSLRNCSHIWLQDPNLTVVLAKHTREVVRTEQCLGLESDPSTEESSLDRYQVWPGAQSNDEGALSVWEEASPSVHLIDAKKTALVEGLRLAPWERGQGVACLRPRFCSQLGRRQRSGVKVAQPSRDDQRNPQELKKYRLNTKQGKSNSSRLPAANRRSLLLETEELGSLDFGDPASRASILSPFRNPNI
ncbi:hypothetical protein QTO34_013640 [Cnephaeus nilssonii]|uniref:Uncharacterized protein n=1 Tax=Cnephaeus nilssonii TaxID=3371016 RepID=A0AA40I8N1_CNENI|nr:hypothetical protein QTO34_013640 [Eptesicus nilssonii]